MHGVLSLIRSLERGDAIIAGVLSGTSADGIDVALTRLLVENGAVRGVQQLAFETRAFEPELGARVRSALEGEALDARGLTLLSRDLGLAFGAAARDLAEERELSLALVGSHGQTFWHHDDVEPSGPASLQLGDGDWVAEAAGCAAVSDFRQRDLAAGGLGAPISVLADDAVFSAAARPAAILNLGGMSNLSWLPGSQAGSREPLAFDCGPAGALLDGLARRLLDRPYDVDGAVAAGGAPQAAVLARWLEHPFFAAAPPKSTGRDTFGEAWLDQILAQASALGVHEAADLLACGVHLVAESIARCVRGDLPEAPRALYMSGGGIHNLALEAALRERVGELLRPASEVGVDPDAREALVFAVLAGRCVLGEAVTAPSATGALAGRVLGKISPPTR